MPSLLARLTPGRIESARMQASWNGVVIAQSDDTVVVEGNHYFPLESVAPSVLQRSSSHSLCPWKGVASYYDVVVDGKLNVNGAWYYPHPLPLAHKIAGRVAFWHGIKVQRSPES